MCVPGAPSWVYAVPLEMSISGFGDKVCVWGEGRGVTVQVFACKTGKCAIGDLMPVTGRSRPPFFCFLYFGDSTVRKIMSDFSLSISVKVWGGGGKILV